MKRSELTQLIKEELSNKVKAVGITVDKLQKGDVMAADKAKVKSVKKDGESFEVTLDNGKTLNYKKGKTIQIIRAGSTLKEGMDSAIEKLVKDDDASEMIALIKRLPDAARKKLAQMFKIELQEDKYEGDPVRGNKILDRGNPNVSLEKDYSVIFYVNDRDYDWDVKAASPEDAIKKVQSGQVEGPYGQALPRLARKFHAQLK
jgi:hypothetical protein